MLDFRYKTGTFPLKSESNLFLNIIQLSKQHALYARLIGIAY